MFISTKCPYPTPTTRLPPHITQKQSLPKELNCVHFVCTFSILPNLVKKKSVLQLDVIMKRMNYTYCELSTCCLWRIAHPKATFLINSTGRVVSIGTTCIYSAYYASCCMMKELKANITEIEGLGIFDFKPHNMTVTMKLGFQVDRKSLNSELPEAYSPAKFSGLLVETGIKRIKHNICPDSLVITGAIEKQDLVDTLRKYYPIYKQHECEKATTVYETNKQLSDTEEAEFLNLLNDADI
jgi:TATA-box binding protein (TBP) (component of TFIID and TFIIIB)